MDTSMGLTTDPWGSRDKAESMSPEAAALKPGQDGLNVRRPRTVHSLISHFDTLHRLIDKENKSNCETPQKKTRATRAMAIDISEFDFSDVEKDEAKHTKLIETLADKLHKFVEKHPQIHIAFVGHKSKDRSSTTEKKADEVADVKEEKVKKSKNKSPIKDLKKKISELGHERLIYVDNFESLESHESFNYEIVMLHDEIAEHMHESSEKVHKLAEEDIALGNNSIKSKKNTAVPQVLQRAIEKSQIKQKKIKEIYRIARKQHRAINRNFLNVANRINSRMEDLIKMENPFAICNNDISMLKKLLENEKVSGLVSSELKVVITEIIAILKIQISALKTKHLISDAQADQLLKLLGQIVA